MVSLSGMSGVEATPLSGRGGVVLQGVISKFAVQMAGRVWLSRLVSV